QNVSFRFSARRRRQPQPPPVAVLVVLLTEKRDHLPVWRNRRVGRVFDHELLLAARRTHRPDALFVARERAEENPRSIRRPERVVAVKSRMRDRRPLRRTEAPREHLGDAIDLGNVSHGLSVRGPRWRSLIP